MKIDSDAIRQLAELLEETGLNEIEVADGDQKIRVNKGASAAVMAAPQALPAAAAPASAGAETPAANAASHPGAVTSPMVGNAYLQAEPGAPSFISKGASVKEGDTLMIIEAMKVMNPIKAPHGGTVTEILIEDGQPVEFGDVLVVIE